MEFKPDIYTGFEPVTGTWQYIVGDPKSYEAVIIDSVLDFGPSKSLFSTSSADKLLDIIRGQHLRVTKIMETHAHADYSSVATYLQQALVHQGQIRPERCIGKRIKEMQAMFARKHGVKLSEIKGYAQRNLT
jgi:glyoxylase-like metal-dependent hydrolase (beta-lactamase superfamily II)